MRKRTNIEPIKKIHSDIKKCPYCHVNNVFGEVCPKCAEELIKKLRKRKV